MRDPPEDDDACDGNPMTTAYGVVAQCNPAICPRHGWLVSERQHPFVFLYVTESGRPFSFGASSSDEKP